LTVAAVGVGGSFAVAELNQPASRIALDTAGGPRGIADGYVPISLRNAGDAALWEVAAFQDSRGGLGMAASTHFDPDPANGATAAAEVLREIREGGGATVYGIVQIDDDPRHVVVYGAALPETTAVEVEGEPVRFADRTVELRAWADEQLGAPIGDVRVFAVELTLADGLTADLVNGTFTGERAADGTVYLAHKH
jgi:hypothetical protein